ncbi:hypothetical protein HGM15179_020808 [Zosterops borbonicus]|uniref:ribonuclease H n=1 Tax=Zosterops borbonicus TaxID=364589 RepID=A0A8K1D5N4_9PASS|nr:hypothetical protein HGM15179_020808 [Zosterops borbonicus]
MRNSLMICQWYVSSLLSPVRAAAEKAIIHHYRDDVLVCAPSENLLAHALDLTVDALIAAGFELQESKIQRMPPWKYLGLEIGLTTEDLAPLFDLLKGGEELSSPRVLTPEAEKALEKVQFLLTALDLTLSLMEVSLVARFLQLFLLASLQMPTNEEIALQSTVNISSDAEDICQNILKAAGEIEKGSEDWLSGMLKDWGLPGWAEFWVKTGLLILFVIILVSIAFCCIKRIVDISSYKAILTALLFFEANRATTPADPENEEPEEFFLVEVDENEIPPPKRYGPFPFPVEEWSTDHEWDTVSYSKPGNSPPQIQETCL